MKNAGKRKGSEKMKMGKRILLTMALAITAILGSTVLCAAAGEEVSTGTAESTDTSPAYGIATLAETDMVSLDTTVQYQQTNARTILDMVNDLRTGSDAWYWNQDGTKYTCADLSALTYDYALEEVAMQRAAEIALFYSHTRPNGSDWNTAYDECGYTYTSAAENIAAGYTSASAVFTGWAEEDENYSGQGHRRNMLSRTVTAIGVACVYLDGTYYWVQEFANPVNSTTPTTANDGSTDVTIQAASGNLTSVTLTPDVSSYELLVGESKTLPSLTEKVRLTETWPTTSSKTIHNSYTWESENSSCAAVSGDKVVANAMGSTYLSATVLTETATVPVTVQKDIANCTVTLDQTSYIYDGTAKEPTATVLDGSTTLISGTDYTVSYSNNTKVGTAAVIIKGKGNYTGTVTASFTIEGTSLKKGSTYTVGKFKYKITKMATDGSGTVTLTKPKKTTLTEATIPAKVSMEGVSFKVTKIKAKAFQNNKKLKTVTIGKNVATIGNQAFSGCTKMTRMTTKAGLTKIGKKAFYNSKNLKTITIKSKKLKTIGKKAITGIKKNATIKVPSGKKKVYKKLFTSKTGYKKTMKIQ